MSSVPSSLQERMEAKVKFAMLSMAGVEPEIMADDISREREEDLKQRISELTTALLNRQESVEKALTPLVKEIEESGDLSFATLRNEALIKAIEQIRRVHADLQTHGKQAEESMKAQHAQRQELQQALSSYRQALRTAQTPGMETVYAVGSNACQQVSNQR